MAVAGIFTGLLVGIVKRLVPRSKRVDVPGFQKKTITRGIIMTIPKTNFKKHDIVYLWGGINYANPSWMLGQIPEKLLDSNIFAIIPYNISMDEAKPLIDQYLGSIGLDDRIADESIMGFSAGGLQVQKSYSPEYKFVGLIDPSTRPSYTKTQYGKNTFLSYSISNWAGVFSSFNYKQVYPELEDAIEESGGFAENTTRGHSSFPKYFMERFANEINKPVKS